MKFDRIINRIKKKSRQDEGRKGCLIWEGCVWHAGGRQQQYGKMRNPFPGQSGHMKNGQFGQVWATMVLAHCEPEMADIDAELFFYTRISEYYLTICEKKNSGHGSLNVGHTDLFPGQAEMWRQPGGPQ